MLDFDPHIMRLQYEILNISPAQLAQDTGMPPEMIDKVIEEEHWKQWWPEEDIHSIIQKGKELNAKEAAEKGDIAATDEELLASQSEQFVERARKRLQVYSLAKEIYLAQKYLRLESSLIKKAHDILEGLNDKDASAIKQLSALYKDMVSKSPMGTLLQLSKDEGGLPQVLIRDLSGI